MSEEFSANDLELARRLSEIRQGKLTAKVELDYKAGELRGGRLVLNMFS